jgi:hypothetical protein
MIKICTKCKIEKTFDEFGKDKKAKDGLRSNCKSCIKEYHQEYRQANKEILKEYRKANKEKYKEYHKEYCQANKERIKEYHKEYGKANKEILKEYRQANKEKKKEYYQENKERIKEISKKYREANKEYRKERAKEYHQANKERINEKNKKWRQANKERANEYQRERKKTNPLFKMKCNLRKRTWEAFKNKGYSKTSKTQEMLGVDWEVAKAHIERQFTKGMNWNNYGEWHIDHIIPLASANNKEELMKLCHYSNLQPLWAEDNLSKSDKIIEQQIKFRI